MKKLLWVSIMILMLSIPTYSQDMEGGGGDFASGGLLIEITTSPFSRDGFGDQLLSVGQFRARYVISERIVPRLGIWYQVNDNNFNAPSPDLVFHESQFNFAPGVEYHFLTEGAFTSYAALDVLITSRSARIESSTGPDIFGTSQFNTNAFTSNDADFGFAQRGRFGYGGYLAMGADYHFSSRFYVGLEIGFSFEMGTTSDIEIDGALYQDGSSYFQSGLNTMNTFRAGFKLF